MSILIIEDEAVAARSLRKLLADLAPDLQIEAGLSSVASAIERLSRADQPELIFMDIQLADGNCFEIFEVLPLTTPVIFTTAFDQFALRAFEVFGVDYLMKPIRPERLALALAKWRALRVAGSPRAVIPAQMAQQYFAETQRYRERFLVPAGSALVSVPSGDIAYFVKELVVRLVTHDGRGYPMSQSLDEVEGLLPQRDFFRLNRQLLVNIDAIGLVHRGGKGKLDVELKPALPEAASVSQERASAFRAWLER